MTTNLEVYFCDVCNQSVPGSDLDAGRAVRLRDRVIGGCCLGQLKSGTATSSAGSSGSRTSALLILIPVLAAIGGASAFLDYRVAEELAMLAPRFTSLDSRIAAATERLDGLAVELTRMSAAQLDPKDLKQGLEGLDLRIAAGSRELQQREGKAQAELGDGLKRMNAMVVVLREEQLALRSSVDAVAASLAVLRAAPEVAVSNRTDMAPPGGGSEAVPPVETDLPADLKHQVASLADEDAGTRFAAVDKLLRSKDPRILPSLIQMARDPNLFVRRLTVEGLRDFRRAESVDVLLVALADSEPLVRFHAIQSLRALTAQRLEFDPDSSLSARTGAQRRWQDWWDKNKASFTF